ncbi:UNVERIFIED_CONTAM: hypothetical protein GTU68_052166 [Idotea baltica]|nr:hypothetical protein [Idotea baltica]
MAKKSPRRALGGLVYSTDSGRHCPGCSNPVSDCRCQNSIVGDGIVRIRRESKGRGGKVVSTITGIILPDEELKALAATLKKMCGCGGSIKNRVIEIQGDRVDTLITALGNQGFTVKKSGG